GIFTPSHYLWSQEVFKTRFRKGCPTSQNTQKMTSTSMCTNDLDAIQECPSGAASV
ncbi:hypothetical protein STEG23_006793, partial [Scotinomys teguina]